MDWSANALRRNAQPPSQSSWSSKDADSNAHTRAFGNSSGGGRDHRAENSAPRITQTDFPNHSEFVSRCELFGIMTTFRDAR